MICKDMKYTALYWALNFEEFELDKYRKVYTNTIIVIDAEVQRVDYGRNIKILSDSCRYLKKHKDFVVLECVDRLLNKGYLPESITIDGREGYADIYIENIAITCEQWGDDYLNKSIVSGDDTQINVIYSSRLTSGLLEYVNRIYYEGKIWDKGLFEDEIEPFVFQFSNFSEVSFSEYDISDFEVYEKTLKYYKGKNKKVIVPEGIILVSASAFWNNTYIEEVVLPKSLEMLGGDCFYYCKNLKKINIPPNLKVMGNNPFAGCPKLEIINESPYFLSDNNVLYSVDKTRIIYYPIKKADKMFSIPDGVKIIGKHCFFACNHLKKIIIPESVIHLENNPFSGCEQLKVENHSDNYIFKNGVIYNKYLTSVVGCLNGTVAETIKLPETVVAINRNSFWNCKGIKKLIISKNVNRIGYNPFAGCFNMTLCGEPSGYKLVNGIIFSADGKSICCATDKAVGSYYKVPSGVSIINRGVFSGCRSLKHIDLNEVLYIDKSAFTDCVSLEKLYIPNSVTYIGEWAFAYCLNLKTINVKRGTKIDKNAFNECPAKIIWRN